MTRSHWVYTEPNPYSRPCLFIPQCNQHNPEVPFILCLLLGEVTFFSNEFWEWLGDACTILHLNLAVVVSSPKEEAELEPS